MKYKKILLNYILYFLVFFGLCIVGISRPLAATIKTIYPSNNFSQNANNYLKLNESGTFGITNTNLTIQGQSYGFNFYMQENVVLNKTYTIVITFMADDLRSDFQNNYVHVNVGSGSTSSSVSIVSITRNNPSGYSTTLTIKFNPLTTGDYIQVNIISDGPPYSVLTGVSTYGIKNVTLDSSADTQDIINNQNQNTQDIINAQQSSSSLIINSQQSSASAIQDTLNNNFNTMIPCQNLFDGVYENGSIGTSNGIPTDTANVIRTKNFTTIEENTNYTMTLPNGATGVIFLFYNNGTYINSKQPTVSNGKTTVFSSSSANQVKWRFNTGFTNLSNQTMFEKGNIASEFCAYGSSSSVNKLDEQTNAINDLNDSINDDDIGGATQDGADFILDFDTNTFGLTSIVTAPLNLIQSLTSSTCSELELPLPFLNNKKLKLPCMTTIYQNTFGVLFTMYQTITFGIIAYWVCVRIFNQVKDFKNPEHDEIEVVDL